MTESLLASGANRKIIIILFLNCFFFYFSQKSKFWRTGAFTADVAVIAILIGDQSVPRVGAIGYAHLKDFEYNFKLVNPSTNAGVPFPFSSLSGKHFQNQHQVVDIKKYHDIAKFDKRFYHSFFRSLSLLFGVNFFRMTCSAFNLL